MLQRSIVAAFFSIVLLTNAGCSQPPRKPVGGNYDDSTMASLIDPPEDTPLYLDAMICIADSKAEKEMLPGRVLAWVPDIDIGSGLVEVYIEDGAADWLKPRMIKILRLMVSYTVPSPFAVDINARNYADFGITPEEINAFRGEATIESISSFSEKEKVALTYADALSRTPVLLPQRLLDDLRRLFTEEEIVAIAALSAKVNYWTRLVEALRIIPAGYTDDPLLHLDDYQTLGKERD